MNEIATRDEGGMEQATRADTPYSDSALVRWAYEAQQAHQIAQSLAKTSFVPATLRGKPDDIAAAILAGQELGLLPMATLRSIDVIQGTPALRAHAMRALVQSHGHEVELVESTPTKCVMRGRRKGSDTWQPITWTLDRARQLGLLSRDQWKKQPQTMLIARATGEICRLIAADVLHAMPYNAEELSTEDIESGDTPPPVSAAELLQRDDGEPEAGAEPDPDEQARAQDEAERNPWGDSADPWGLDDPDGDE